MKKDVNLVAVCKETAPAGKCEDDECLGVGEFGRNYWPNGELFKDDALGMYEGNGKFGANASFNPIKIAKGVWSLRKRLKEKDVGGNMAGEGTVVGGIVVMSRDGAVQAAFEEPEGGEIDKEAVGEALIKAVKG